ncbi:MAG: hypothetical protein AAB677_00550 [Patescibacteria group bacterium]
MRGIKKVVRKPPSGRIEIAEEPDSEPRATDFKPGDWVRLKGNLAPSMQLRLGLNLPGCRGITDFKVQGVDERNNSVRIETGGGTVPLDPGRLERIAQSIQSWKPARTV